MLPRHLYNQNNKLFCTLSILTLCLKNVTTLSRYNSDIRQSILTIVLGPFVKRFALCYRTVVCLSVYPVCDVGVLWPNGWMDQDKLAPATLC